MYSTPHAALCAVHAAAVNSPLSLSHACLAMLLAAQVAGMLQLERARSLRLPRPASRPVTWQDHTGNGCAANRLLAASQSWFKQNTRRCFYLLDHNNVLVWAMGSRRQDR